MNIKINKEEQKQREIRLLDCFCSEIVSTMRLIKGSKVDVLSKKEVSTGASLCAEIISGNGHTYSVRYDVFPMTSGAEAVVERVPRKALRPRPPPLVGADNWVPSDLVEVFHNQSWKKARVTEVLGGNNFFVRLIGSSEEFRLHRSYLWVQQCWRDGKWIVVGGAGYDCSPVEKNAEVQKPHMISTRTLKRGSPLGSSTAAAKKMRVIEKDGNRQQMCYPYPASQKVAELILLF